MTYRSRCVLNLLLFVGLICFAPGCTEDDPEPRPTGGRGGSINGFSSQPGDDDDAGDTGDTGDAGDAGDADDDADGQACDIDLPLPGDERYPCCFDDQDCTSSNSPFADELRCYHATCSDEGWGTCRRRPPEADTNECWADSDCDDGQSCAFDPDLDVDCTVPGTQEVWDVCVESD